MTDNYAFPSGVNEQLATKEFVERVNGLRRSRNLAPLSWNTAVKFLMARKFDVNRSVILYEQHESTRYREGLAKLDPLADPLRTELSSGKFTILPNRDSTGAAIAVFRARLHDPRTTTQRTTLQAVVYQLDVALESTQTQRCGLVFVYDMTESIYQNFDYQLSQKILNLLKGGYPARLKKVLIVTAPLWFKAPFRVLRLFVREKLRERVYTISLPDLANHIPPAVLPIHLGGHAELDHDSWLDHCRVTMTNGKPSDLCDVGSPIEGGTEGPLPCGGDSGIIPSDFEISSMNCDTLSEDSNCSCLSSDDEDEGRPDSEVPTLVEICQKSQALDEKGQEEVTRLNGVDASEDMERVSPTAPPSSGSSGFSDSDDSLHYDDGSGISLEEFVRHLRAKGRQGLHRDYQAIKTQPPEGTFENSRKRCNVLKNRYTDVLCLDHSRVPLIPEDQEGLGDYINANFVDGYKQKNAFISTQGPLPGTFSDFWQMVWEQRVCVVVMTTRAVERGRTKCGEYWPPKEGVSVTYARFTVTNCRVVEDADYTVAELTLVDNTTGMERKVEHMQFTSWPDYGVPDSAVAMLDFLGHVREAQSRLTAAMSAAWTGHPLGPPIVVHCSAGIGRTGTFCTMDICIRRLEDVATIDVRGTVEKIRSQRAYSIQMPDQYVFCHLALLEYALIQGKLLEVDLTGFEEDSESE